MARLPAGLSLAALRRDLLLPSIVAAVVIALAAIAYGTAGQADEARREAESRAREHAAALALGFEEQTVRTLRSIDQLLRVLVHEHTLHTGHGDWMSVARALHWDPTLLVNVAVADASGMLVTMRGAQSPAVDVSDRDYFRYHRERATGETHIGPPIVGRVSGRSFVHMSRRLAHADGSFAGVVVAAVSPEYLTRFHAQADMGRNSLLALVGADGTPIARRVGDVLVAGGDPACEALVAKAAREPTGLMEGVGFDGVRRVHGYRAIEDYPVVAVVGFAEADLYAGLEQRQHEIRLLGLVMALGVLGAAGLVVAGVRRLRRLHRLLVESLDQAPEGIFRTTPAGRFALANRSLARILGYDSPRQLMEERDDIGADGYVDARRREEFKQLMEREGSVVGFEYQARRRDGSAVWVTESARAVRDRHGRIAWYEGTLEDIDLRRRAEEALHAADRRAIEGYERLVGRLADLADALAAASRPEAMLQSLREFVARAAPCDGMRVTLLDHGVPGGERVLADDLPATGERQASLLVPMKIKGERLGSLEIRSAAREAYDSEHFTALRMAAPLFAMAIENARLLERERSLRLSAEDSERLKAAVLESAQDAIIAVDARSVIVEFNRAAEALFGCAREQAIGTDFVERFIPPALRAQHREGLDKRSRRERTQAPRRFDTRAQRADGSDFPVEVSIARIEAADPPLFTAFIRDLTERERAEAAHAQLEEQLRQSQKMEAVGRLAGGIAHDFNNFIGAILGNVELAWSEPGVPPGVRDSLGEIRKAGERARDLTQQILSFSRRQPTQRQVISLAAVAEDSVRLLRATLPARVQLRFSAAPDAPPVCADVVQMGQVVINLCVNAADAMDGSAGIVDVKVARGAAGEAVLVVSDNGRGMDDTVRSRIWEPFFTTKAAGGGTGLGLPVVDGIVAAHGGRIELTTAPGRGTTFRIVFPAAQGEPVRAPERVPEPAVSGRGRSVLYLDDDEAMVNLTRRILRRRGYRVTAFTQQEEALHAIRRSPGEFDVLVTDQNMPGMSGLEVVRAARDVDASLPVLLASGYITDELAAEAQAAGVAEIVFKPRIAEDLAQAVERLLALR